MVLARGGLSAAEGAPPFADLFAALPVATIVLDEAGCVAHANSAAELLLNLSDRSMRGLSLSQIVTLPPGYGDQRDGHGFASYECELRLRRGGRLRADFHETPAGHGSPWRIVMLYGLRAMPAAPRAAGARAAAGAAAMLGHEIKNPLSGIRGAAQLLADEVDDRGVLTDLIITEVDRIAALIDRMEDFTDARPRELTVQNIYPVIAHAVQLATAGFARGIVIEERFDPSLPPVRIDRDAFVQVLVNLLKNAAEALADTPDPRIVVGTAYRHGMSHGVGGGARRAVPIELSVGDNGPGAPSDIAGHLFEPFVSGKREGRGFGLPMVEKLMAEMGGTVGYAREGDPEWTIFRIRLPRA
ncbi:PAS domain-containing sensor histidine kinase [Sphingomonas sp. Leaf407]|uniref:two-component system sensor histidine kinase NtrB n=1 Tax=unclassified Sphingomonas TaxID=196159 RepID=UPI0006FA0FE4|nr:MULTISPECIES: ATP-binding protein [unclassified Sphingomonas]KQN36841.1 PAS domain-containing sensor histidine kinase [Sphingomonas sp. Leaf42]KQT30268.1 PAS domain-containing sensor histidine kinase [Sphingomonas sp. Leaf407]